MAGRKRILNEARQREICALISAGCGIEDAAKYVGCTPITIRREVHRNPQFAERLRQAQMSAQLTPLQALRKAAGSHWRAAAWLLERIEPQRFVKSNPNVFSDKQVSAVIHSMADAVRQEVDDPSVYGRVVDRFAEIERKAVFNTWAAKATYAQVDKAYPHPQPSPRLAPETTDSNSVHATDGLPQP